MLCRRHDGGREIIGKVDELGLSSQYIQLDLKHPTGTVDVTLDANGIPSYIIHENVAWDYIKLLRTVLIWLKEQMQFVLFSCAKIANSRNTIISILKSTYKGNNDNCLKVLI